MTYLLDTGILLRLTNEDDPQHEIVTNALQHLIDRHQEFATTSQNTAEFWNVASRPKELNGLGLTIDVVSAALSRTIEPSCPDWWHL
jgi:predicted nucleic acid-binding protein